MFRPLPRVPDHTALELEILAWWEERQTFERLREAEDAARSHAPEVRQVVVGYGDSLQRLLVASDNMPSAVVALAPSSGAVMCATVFLNAVSASAWRRSSRRGRWRSQCSPWLPGRRARSSRCCVVRASTTRRSSTR